jgi:DNA-binding CsgD family transcriptional regulator
MLYGREHAWSELESARAAAFAGRGGAIVVGGAVGVGKSALLDAFALDAAQAGALALTAVACEAESRLPLAVFEQFLLGARLPEAEREQFAGLVAHGAAAMRCHGADEAVDAEVRISAADAEFAGRVCASLLALSARTALVLVVDDVPHVDAASAVCLGFLARRVRAGRLLLVFGEGGGGHGPGVRLCADVLRLPHARLIQLGRLERADAAQLLAENGAAPAPSVFEACYTATGGSPMLLRGAARDVAGPAGQKPDTAVHEVGYEKLFVPGGGYTRAVLGGMHRSGAFTRSVAHGVAVLGDAARVGRLLGLDAAAAELAVRALEAAGILDAGRYRHPAARQVALADLEPGLRADLHGRAADLGRRDGLPATIIAEHLGAAGRGSEAWAVPILEEAALQALEVGHVDAAVEYLTLACDACADAPHRARLTTTLVRAQWRADPCAPARHLTTLVDALRAGHLSGADSLVLARALLWHGRIDAASEVLTRLAESDALNDPETLAELRVIRPWLRCSFAPLLAFVPDEAAAHEQRPVGTEARRRLAAASALDDVLTGGPTSHVVQEAERILRGIRLEGMGMDAVESALLALTYAEQPHRAAPWCDELMEEATARQAPSRRARLSAIRGEISLRQGEFEASAGYARAGLELIPAEAWGVPLGGCVAVLITALTAMGRHAQAVQALNLPVPEATLTSRYGLHYLRARGRAALAGADAEGAAGDFRHCGELATAWRMDVPGLVPWRIDLAEAHLALEDRAAARQLAEEQLRRSPRALSPNSYGAALRVLAATQEQRSRPALLRKSVEALQTGTDRYALALSLADLAAVYHELCEQRRAKVIGRQAWRLAVECGAQPLAERLAADAAAPESHGPAGVLSDAEQRVAELVAQGYTNLETSRRLYLSVSTVEQHLTRIYRKFGVTSRADMALALTAEPRRPAVAGAGM